MSTDPAGQRDSFLHHHIYALYADWESKSHPINLQNVTIGLAGVSAKWMESIISLLFLSNWKHSAWRVFFSTNKIGKGSQQL